MSKLERIYISTKDFAIKVHMHPESVRRANRAGTLGIKPRVFHGKLLWREDEIDALLDASTESPSKFKKKVGRPTKQSEVEARLN